MAGRNKQPLAVIQGKGRSNHLTKDEIKKRQSQEEQMKGFTDNIEAPKYLTKKQKEEFNHLSTELLRLGIFSNLDVDNLARYIDSKDQYIKLIKLIRKVKPAEDFKSYSAMQRSKNLLFNECRSSANDLGLTITSRLKLVIPKTDEKPQPKTEAEKRFSGRL
ncbi:phage terminase small subunit P27 family [Virgibacillus sp. M23]|uniref:phage terminase small subunit P27 family n=1 Tax=Virgibacillus sp. M23 TaxID=3079030 RepID=UPI002A909440|nr:phage terminase small subunit P27 family [Virgibacillus sp. M23]MDY7044046.1 phage terminase small subunit P27 family [Virgibacillus sp. M23]